MTVNGSFREQDPPRAASCIQGSPLFNKYSKHIGIRFNDRVMLRSVYSYNMDEGWIETAVPGHRGQPKYEGGRIVTVRVPGKVEAYWR